VPLLHIFELVGDGMGILRLEEFLLFYFFARKNSSVTCITLSGVQAQMEGAIMIAIELQRRNGGHGWWERKR